jgi:hypothetical protein
MQAPQEDALLDFPAKRLGGKREVLKGKAHKALNQAAELGGTSNLPISLRRRLCAPVPAVRDPLIELGESTQPSRPRPDCERQTWGMRTRPCGRG